MTWVTVLLHFLAVAGVMAGAIAALVLLHHGADRSAEDDA